MLYNVVVYKDRTKILKIHTKNWNPALRDDFLVELAEKCAGMCLLTLCWAQHGRLFTSCRAGLVWCKLHASIPVRLPSYCSKRLWWEQPVKEVQLTSIFCVQLCVYSSSYGDFLRWIDHRSAAFADSTHSDRDIFVPITITLSYSSLMYGHC